MKTKAVFLLPYKRARKRAKSLFFENPSNKKQEDFFAFSLILSSLLSLSLMTYALFAILRRKNRAKHVLPVFVTALCACNCFRQLIRLLVSFASSHKNNAKMDAR